MVANLAMDRKRWHKRALKIKQWLILLKALSVCLYAVEYKRIKAIYEKLSCSVYSEAACMFLNCALQSKLPISGIR